MLIWIGREAVLLVADLRDRYVLPDETIVPSFNRDHLESLIADTSTSMEIVLCRADEIAPEWLQTLTYRHADVQLARVSSVSGGEGNGVNGDHDEIIPVFAPTSEGLTALAEHFGWRQRVQTVRVAPVSYKGGSGKTIVIINLAAALGRRGYRVLVIEGDVTDDNVRRLTGADASPSINALVSEYDTAALTPAILSDHVQSWDQVDNVDLLVAVHGQTQRDLQRQSTAGAVLRAADGLYDFVLVDLPADNRYASSFAAAILDMEETVRRQLFLVIASYGITEVEGADRALSLLRRRCVALVPEHNVALVANRVGNAVGTLDDYLQQLTTTYGVPLVATLPDVGEEMQFAGIAGQPLMTYRRKLDVADHIRKRGQIARVDEFREEIAELAGFVEGWRTDHVRNTHSTRSAHGVRRKEQAYAHRTG